MKKPILLAAAVAALALTPAFAQSPAPAAFHVTRKRPSSTRAVSVASARALAVMEMAEKAERLYLLTGTPMPTRSKDLYNMLVMLH